jgi:hypothetical protein
MFSKTNRPRRLGNGFALIQRVLLTAIIWCSTSVTLADLEHRFNFNDGSISDLVGTATGTLYNGASISNGWLVFNNDGISSNSATGQYAALSTNVLDYRNFTLETWFTFQGGRNWQRIVDFGNCTNSGQDVIGKGFLILTMNSSVHPLGQISINSWGGVTDTDYVLGPTNRFPVGGEHQIVYTHNVDMGYESLYLDGLLIGTNAAHMDASTAIYTNLWLGRSQFAHDPFFNGSIDELRTYDAPLTASQVWLDYLMGPDLVATAPNLFTYTTNNGTITITGCLDFSQPLVIPSEIDGMPVVSIGDGAFRNSALSGVTFAYSITNIGASAFQECYALKSVDIPSNVVSIGDSAFEGCWYVTNLTLTSGLRSIGASAFTRCRMLNLHIPDSVVSIGSSCFSSCDRIGSVTIPEVVTNLGASAFWGCYSLTNVTIAAPISTLSPSLFARCQNLTSVSLPSTITSIEDGAFYSCWSLNNPQLPNSITNIGCSAFNDCGSLSIISLPMNLVRIGSNAFEFCFDLRSIIIPQTVSILESSSFSNCFHLSIVHFLGDAPGDGSDLSVFNNDPWILGGGVSSTIYYHAGMSGWGATFDGRPTALYQGPTIVTVLASSPEGGNVTGGGAYDLGSSIVLTAAASNGWLFSRWDDGETNATRSVIVPPTNITYTANFAPAATITVGVNTNSGGSATGGGTFFVGSNTSLMATASQGWAFTGWNDGDTNNPRTIVALTNMTLTAQFSQAAHLTVLASTNSIGYEVGGGLGTIRAEVGGSVSGSGVFAIGSTNLILATASNGWQFIGWHDGLTNNPRIIIQPPTDLVFTATFLPKLVLDVFASPPAGGAVLGGGAYVIGSANVQLQAVASNQWTFTGWSDGVLANPRSVIMPGAVLLSHPAYTATFQKVAVTLGEALNATGSVWSCGGAANWSRQVTTTHDGVAAARSGSLGAGQQTWFQMTTNGPLSLIFWWKVSSAADNSLQFYIGTQLISQISGNVGWNQYATFIGHTNPVTLKWVYTKNNSTISGSDAGFVDQVTILPCPYATNVPALFFQDNTGLLASWVLNSTGGFQFARVLANTGGWTLKAAGDIDGDGVSDLLFQHSTGTVAAWFLQADGSLRETCSWAGNSGWELKAVGDFEGLGVAGDYLDQLKVTLLHTQLFFQNSNGVVAYWRLLHSIDWYAGYAGPDYHYLDVVDAPLLGNMGGWKLRGAGDLDGDHKAELFWQNAAGQVAIWWHDGPGGTFRGAFAFSTGEWALCGVSDVDADGVSDLLWQTPDTRTGGWFMQTNGVARDASFWWPTGGWKLKAAGR